jgi:hypothetical protein
MLLLPAPPSSLSLLLAELLLLLLAELVSLLLAELVSLLLAELVSLLLAELALVEELLVVVLEAVEEGVRLVK